MEKFNAPWRYIKEQGIVYDSSDEMVCDVMPTGEQWEEDNAHLIAAAPEMYEELMAVHSQMACDCNRAACSICSGKKDIEKLLAKARGEDNV